MVAINQPPHLYLLNININMHLLKLAQHKILWIGMPRHQRANPKVIWTTCLISLTPTNNKLIRCNYSNNNSKTCTNNNNI